MWTGAGLDAERGGSDVGSRFIPAAAAARAGEARATFPARLSPPPAEAHSLAGSLWISEENSTACLPLLSAAGDGVYLNPTVHCRPRLESIAQESWGHYVSVLTPGVRKPFCAIWSDRRPVFPSFGKSINVFLIGTDGSVKLDLAPFCFALAIKENSGICSLQSHKYTEPFAQ